VKFARMKREAVWDGMAGVEVFRSCLWCCVSRSAVREVIEEKFDVVSSRVLRGRLRPVDGTAYCLCGPATDVCGLAQHDRH
jgi:hypothetical protein